MVDPSTPSRSKSSSALIYNCGFVACLVCAQVSYLWKNVNGLYEVGDAPVRNEPGIYSYSQAISLLAEQHNGMGSMGLYRKTGHEDRVEGLVKDAAPEEYGIYRDKKRRMELRETMSDTAPCSYRQRSQPNASSFFSRSHPTSFGGFVLFNIALLEGFWAEHKTIAQVRI
jgi:hypothetical protein